MAVEAVLGEAVVAAEVAVEPLEVALLAGEALSEDVLLGVVDTERARTCPVDAGAARARTGDGGVAGAACSNIEAKASTDRGRWLSLVMRSGVLVALPLSLLSLLLSGEVAAAARVAVPRTTFVPGMTVVVVVAVPLGVVVLEVVLVAAEPAEAVANGELDV